MSQNNFSSNHSVNTSSEVKIANFLIDVKRRRLTSSTVSHDLNWKTFSVLMILFESAGKVVTRERLIDEVWEGNHPVGDKAMSTAIWNLRKIFEEYPELIETIPKKGYRMRMLSFDNKQPTNIEEPLENNIWTIGNISSNIIRKNWLIFLSLLIVGLVIGYGFKSDVNSVDKQDSKLATQNPPAVLILTRVSGHDSLGDISRFIGELERQIVEGTNLEIVDENSKSSILNVENLNKEAGRLGVVQIVYLEFVLLNDQDIQVKVKLESTQESSFSTLTMNSKLNHLDSLIPQITQYLPDSNWQ